MTGQEMVERVARALCEMNFRQKGSEGEFGTVDDCWWAFVDEARLIVEASQLAGVVGERDRYRQALQDVINPLAKLRRDAEADGNRLSGMAHSIANDLGFVRSIAREALSPNQGAKL